MTKTPPPSSLFDRILPRGADRYGGILIVSLIGVSLLVQVATEIAEARRNLLAIEPLEILLLEGSSHAAILCLLPLFPFILDRLPLDRSSVPRLAFGHVLAAAAFCLAHVSLMWLFRISLFPALLGRTYDFDLLAPKSLAYEFGKDAFTYAIILVTLVLVRMAFQRREDNRAALESARLQRRVTLKSGSQQIIVTPAEVIFAKAASNYVEVTMANRNFLARMTLANLEAMLNEAGGRHLRVHRSFVVNPDAIRSIAPAGDGDLVIELLNGMHVQGSRRYRAKLLEGGAFAGQGRATA